MTCIFIDQPNECSYCSNPGKLQCLLNHQHLKVSPEGLEELNHILLDNINSPYRVKTKSGHKEGI